MSAAVLAARMGTTAGAVTRLEQSEAADRIRLDTLRRAADALGCDLVYLLVPRRPLTAVVRDRARELAHWQVAAVEQTMRLTDEERQGLRLPVLTRAELNRAEAENISRAMAWLFFSRRRLQPESVTREAWLQGLHRRMYGQVWAWAGQYRTTDRNLGVPYWQVRLDMRNLEADVNGWLADPSAARYGHDECAIRFGYRLVVSHPFPHGNGRWSRLAADALIVALGGSRFTWGGATLTESSALRRDYISALQTADTTGDFEPLIVFARR